MFTIHDSHMIYGFSDMECNRLNFLSFWFLPFYTTNNLKNLNFEKLKKNPGDIIMLNKCTKNHDHMLHCPLDMAHNRCNYFSFWTIFCPLNPPDSPKNKNLKKMRKNLEISSFYITVQKIMIR